MLGLGVVPFDTCTVVLRSKRASRLFMFLKISVFFYRETRGRGHGSGGILSIGDDQ